MRKKGDFHAIHLRKRLFLALNRHFSSAVNLHVAQPLKLRHTLSKHHVQKPKYHQYFNVDIVSVRASVRPSRM